MKSVKFHRQRKYFQNENHTKKINFSANCEVRGHDFCIKDCEEEKKNIKTKLKEKF